MNVANFFGKREKKESFDVTKGFNEVICGIDPMFNTMSIGDKADIIGISNKDFLELYKRQKSVLHFMVKDLINDLAMAVEKRVDDQEFKNKLISKIRLLENYGFIYKFTPKCLRGTFETSRKADNYNFEMFIGDDNVKFMFCTDNKAKTLSGEHKKNESGTSSIKYCETKSTVSHVDNNRDFYNLVTQKNIHVFDREDKETFSYKFEKQENYYLNNKTHVKNISEPNPSENYTDIIYSWRAPENTIIMREKKQYDCQENTTGFIKNEDAFKIGFNTAPEEKRLAFDGKFVWFDKDLYKEYIGGKCSIEKILKFKGDNYRKR